LGTRLQFLKGNLQVQCSGHIAQVDPSVSFDQVGGLEHYIKALKEMVFLPLVYPELFERFHLSPPRGVLFYGPPGMYCKEISLALCLMSFADLVQLLPKTFLLGF